VFGVRRRGSAVEERLGVVSLWAGSAHPVVRPRWGYDVSRRYVGRHRMPAMSAGTYVYLDQVPNIVTEPAMAAGQPTARVEIMIRRDAAPPGAERVPGVHGGVRDGRACCVRTDPEERNDDSMGHR